MGQAALVPQQDTYLPGYEDASAPKPVPYANMQNQVMPTMARGPRKDYKKYLMGTPIYFIIILVLVAVVVAMGTKYFVSKKN